VLLANGGQIPIAFWLLADQAECVSQSGSDPHWRVGVNSHPRPGCAPGGAVTFLLRKRKVTKRKAPPLPASHCYRTGKPAVLASGGVWLNSLRSNNASPYPPEAVLLGASRGGPRGSGSVARSATSRLGREPGAAGPDVRSRSHAVWRRRVAQGWADQGPRLSEPQASSSGTPPRSVPAQPGDDFGSPFLW